MKTISATELARNLKECLDSVGFLGEEYTILRNQRPVAHLVPGVVRLDALHVMGDLYRSLPPDAGKDWLRDSRSAKARAGVRNPWG